MKKLLRRDAWTHKGENGRVLIVAGSEIYTGAPYFNGMGAWRTGVDLVHLVGHRRAMDCTAFQAPELITHPLKGELKRSDVPLILKLAEEADVVLLGGGLARNKETHAALAVLIQKIKAPLVCDAEALHVFKKGLSKNPSILLTPHAGEFLTLTGEWISIDIKDRKAKTQQWAKKLGATILLKGHIDVISDGTITRLNTTGTPTMSKGGTGDVLAGLCAGFIAQGFSCFDAAYQAARINGLAGEKASKLHGSGFRIEEILDEIM